MGWCKARDSSGVECPQWVDFALQIDDLGTARELRRVDYVRNVLKTRFSDQRRVEKLKECRKWW